MNEWPTNWRHETLRAIGVPVSQHALDVLHAWEQSTPTQPWTNNPLGLRHGKGDSVKVFDTQYGAFGSHHAFHVELKRLVHSVPGKPLVHALLTDGDVAGAWRAISSMRLPGGETETDYPSSLLDMVEQKYRSNLGGTNKGQRKSIGSGRPLQNPHHPVTIAAISTRKATADVMQLRKALDVLMREIK